MECVTPVISEEFQPDEVVFGKGQEEFIPLPAIMDRRGIVLTRWRLTEEERMAIAGGADLYLSLMTSHQPMQPVFLEVGDCYRCGMQRAADMGLLPVLPLDLLRV